VLREIGIDTSVAVYCSVLQCVSVCCRVAGCCRVLQGDAVCCNSVCIAYVRVLLYVLIESQDVTHTVLCLCVWGWGLEGVESGWERGSHVTHI